MPSSLHPPVPPVSRRSQPHFSSRSRRDQLAAAFTEQGPDYDRLRPGYPPQVIDAIIGAVPSRQDGSSAVVDLGAGTGKLALPLAARGAALTAVDPARAMLDVIDAARPASGADGSVRTVVGTAERTGLPTASADLVTAAQSWHWFDTVLAAAEAARLLRPRGVLALLWNTMDVQIPWVHRYSRIMHAGDVQRDDFTPPMTGGFEPLERLVVRWEDPRTTAELIDLARTRSYLVTADEATRERVRGNLDWYLHEHLGHERGAVVGLPYRTDLFLYRRGS